LEREVPQTTAAEMVKELHPASVPYSLSAVEAIKVWALPITESPEALVVVGMALQASGALVFPGKAIAEATATRAQVAVAVVLARLDQTLRPTTTAATVALVWRRISLVRAPRWLVVAEEPQIRRPHRELAGLAAVVREVLERPLEMQAP
jgi:hypothetical protein